MFLSVSSCLKKRGRREGGTKFKPSQPYFFLFFVCPFQIGNILELNKEAQNSSCQTSLRTTKLDTELNFFPLQMVQYICLSLSNLYIHHFKSLDILSISFTSWVN